MKAKLLFFPQSAAVIYLPKLITQQNGCSLFSETALIGITKNIGEGNKQKLFFQA